MVEASVITAVLDGTVAAGSDFGTTLAYHPSHNGDGGVDYTKKALRSALRSEPAFLLLDAIKSTKKPVLSGGIVCKPCTSVESGVLGYYTAYATADPQTLPVDSSPKERKKKRKGDRREKETATRKKKQSGGNTEPASVLPMQGQIVICSNRDQNVSEIKETVVYDAIPPASRELEQPDGEPRRSLHNPRHRVRVSVLSSR